MMHISRKNRKRLQLAISAFGAAGLAGSLLLPASRARAQPINTLPLQAPAGTDTVVGNFGYHGTGTGSTALFQFNQLVAGVFGQTFNLKASGAQGNVQGWSDGIITSGSTSLTSASADFTAADVGKHFWADCIGVSGAPLDTSIASFVNSGSIGLTAAASYSSTGYCLQYAAVANPGSGFAPGDTIVLSGGSANLFPKVTVTATTVNPADLPTVVTSGTGGTNGNICVVSGTTGTAASGFGLAEFIVQIGAGGGIANVLATANQGLYTTNPTTLSVEPVVSVNCGGLNSATLNLSSSMGVGTVSPVYPGDYSAAPPGTATQGTTTGGGHGATFTLQTIQGGHYGYGTDDSAVLSGVITAANARFLATGQPSVIVVPPGAYLLYANSMPALSQGTSIIGAGSYTSKFIIDPGFASGWVFAWNEAWLHNSWVGSSWVWSSQTPAPTLQGVGIFGSLMAPAEQDAIQFQDRNDDIQIRDVIVRGLAGACLNVGQFVSQLGNTLQAYGRESQFALRCYNTGLPLIPAISLNSYASGAGSDATNELYLDLRVFGSQGNGVVVSSQDTDKTTTLLNFTELSSEDAGVANPLANDLSIGTLSDTGGISSIHVYGLDLNTTPASGCAMQIGGGAGSTQSFGISVYGGTIQNSTSGVCYRNVRNSEVHLDTISSSQQVFVGPEMGGSNALIVGAGYTPGEIQIVNSNPANIRMSLPGTGVMWGPVPVPNFFYGTPYGPAPGAASYPATGFLNVSPMGLRSTGILQSLSFNIAASGGQNFAAEVCVYAENNIGLPGNLWADSGIQSVTGTLSGIDTFTLGSGIVLPGPGNYWIGMSLSGSPSGTINSYVAASAGSELMTTLNGNSAVSSLYSGTTQVGRRMAFAPTGTGCPTTFSTAPNVVTGAVPYVAIGF